VCLGSWILSASCSPVPTLLVLLCARSLSHLFCWLGLLSLVQPCLLVTSCLLLDCCAAVCALSQCRPRTVLLGVAIPPSVPLGVSTPKLCWGKVRFLILFLFETIRLDVQEPSLGQHRASDYRCFGRPRLEQTIRRCVTGHTVTSQNSSVERTAHLLYIRTPVVCGYPHKISDISTVKNIASSILLPL
jgi:hypothetical protein